MDNNEFTKLNDDSMTELMRYLCSKDNQIRVQYVELAEDLLAIEKSARNIRKKINELNSKRTNDFMIVLNGGKENE